MAAAAACICRGMDETFSTLSGEELQRHATWLRRVAMALVRDEASADDLVQSTLLAAVRRPPELSRDVRPWFERVLRNFVRQNFRGQVRRERRETRLDAPQHLPGAEELLIRHEAARVVAGLVSQLREPYRSTVLLHFAEGVQLKDVAARQGVPAGTVRRRLKEALDELRGHLDDHYRGQQRDWRAMLLPIGSAPADGPMPRPGLAAATKGAILMSTKAKVAVVVGAALALWWGVHLWLPPVDRHGGGAAQPAVPAAVPAAAARRITADPAAAVPPRRPAPPSFAAAASGPPLTDLASCERALERLRRERDDNQQTLITPGGSSFDQMQASPKNQRILAPIIDRILAGFQPKPEYTLECRVSRCRLTLLAPEGGKSDPWLKAVESDEELSSKLTAGGGTLGWAVSSRNVKDALSGKDSVHSQLFFTVPARRGARSHPFDVGDDPPQAAAPGPAGSLATCREQVTALRQQLDVRRDELEKVAAEENDPQSFSVKSFQAARPNPELTGKFRLVLAALMASGAVPPTATAECRGDGDCQLSFTGPVKSRADDQQDHRALMDQLAHLLEQNGYTSDGTRVSKSLSADDTRPSETETSILTRLRRSGAPVRPPR
jgi:RNA polymerase sigma factor (sigma-70 family)